MNVHFDFIASIYDRVMGKPDVHRLCDLLRLPAEGLLLDAGGGTGRVSSLLSHMVGGVVVSDLSHAMLKQARKKESIWPVRAHAEILPFSDGMFERVLVVDSLHHFCDQADAIRELLRVLGRGGRLVIEEPDISRRPVKLVAMAEKLALMGSHFYSTTKIQDMIRSHGLYGHIERGDRFRVWIVVDT